MDEKEPRPLPNLDFKIMQGDSLLESFEGIDLSRLHTGQATGHALTTILGSDQGEFELDAIKAQMDLRTAARREAITGLIDRYFSATDPAEKSRLHHEVDAHVREHIAHAIGYQRDAIETRLHRAHAEFAKNRKAARGWEPSPREQKMVAALEAEIESLNASAAKLATLEGTPQRPFFLWHLFFQDVFAQGGFDIVIANPPYVRHETISEIAPALRELYTVAASRADLLIFFYEKAVNLLRENGILTFITSNKFYRAGYGSKLRPFLTSNLSLHSLVDFGDTPVFEAIAYASILIGTKQQAPASHKLLAYTWQPNDSLSFIPHTLERSAIRLQQSELTPDGWRLEDVASSSLLKKLRTNGTPLGEFVGGKFFRGIITGLNEAFVITGEQRDALIRADAKSADLIKPFLRGRDVKRWTVHHEDLHLIVFPHGFHPELKNYPAIHRHLRQFETALKNRGQCKASRGNKEGGQHHWLELDNNPKAEYLDAFAGKKIVMPAIERAASFAVDLGGHYSNDKTNICISEKPEALCAILNSQTLWWALTRIAATKQNGYYEFKPLYIRELPIPDATPADQSTLTTLAKRAAKSTGPELAAIEREIDRIVYRLFALTPKEIALIESRLPSKP